MSVWPAIAQAPAGKGLSPKVPMRAAICLCAFLGRLLRNFNACRSILIRYIIDYRPSAFLAFSHATKSLSFRAFFAASKSIRSSIASRNSASSQGTIAKKGLRLRLDDDALTRISYFVPQIRHELAEITCFGRLHREFSDSHRLCSAATSIEGKCQMNLHTCHPCTIRTNCTKCSRRDQENRCQPMRQDSSQASRGGPVLIGGKRSLTCLWSCGGPGRRWGGSV